MLAERVADLCRNDRNSVVQGRRNDERIGRRNILPGRHGLCGVVVVVDTQHHACDKVVPHEPDHFGAFGRLLGVGNDVDDDVVHRQRADADYGNDRLGRTDLAGGDSRRLTVHRQAHGSCCRKVDVDVARTRVEEKVVTSSADRQANDDPAISYGDRQFEWSTSLDIDERPTCRDF